jgi:acetyl esterase/lipase
LIYHGGGLMVGSSEMFPKAQINHLAAQNFGVVIPNYRLAPQVTAKEAFADCEEAYEWATKTLPGIITSKHEVELDSSKVVAIGHSSGGSLALHMASCKPVKAVTAFYPSLFSADTSTSAHKPTSAPPFGIMPDFEPTAEDWAEIKPEGKQVSEAGLAAPGTVPAPRNKWQMHILKHGEWMGVVLPDSDYAAIDPMTRLNSNWPPVMIVQGEIDNVPGSNLESAQRAEKEMKAAGVKEVRLEVVPGESHMFDLPPTVGTSDKDHKWQAVLKGLDWLTSHV